jgi:thiamine-monophosphate kinase
MPMTHLHDVLENRLLSRWADLLPRAPAQRGRVHETDAELIEIGDGRLLALTVDSIDEEIRAGLYGLETAGRVAAVASLSDLAAVGAEPFGLLLAVGLDRDDPEATQHAIAEGVARTCRAAGVFVLGGDTSATEAPTVACVAAGLVPAAGALSRVGCAPGDLVFATGPFGAGAALALRKLVLEPGVAAAEDAYQPRARLREALLLRGRASACMDTSDGLVATLDQLARLNGLAIRVTAEPARLLDPDAARLREALGLPAMAFLAAEHGEYELAFTVPERELPALERAAGAIDRRLVPIGRVEAGEGLWIGDRPVDGAALRNLSRTAHGDVRTILEALGTLRP